MEDGSGSKIHRAYLVGRTTPKPAPHYTTRAARSQRDCLLRRDRRRAPLCYGCPRLSLIPRSKAAYPDLWCRLGEGEVIYDAIGNLRSIGGQTSGIDNVDIAIFNISPDILRAIGKEAVVAARGRGLLNIHSSAKKERSLDILTFPRYGRAQEKLASKSITQAAPLAPRATGR